MSKVQFIGVDVGRDSVKVVSNGEKHRFKSAVGEHRALNIKDQGGDYEVEIDGKPWFVAEMAQESYFGREMTTENKIHEETKVLFLTAVALVADSDAKLRVVTGMPINQNKPEEKQALVNLLKGSHTVKIGKRKATYKIDEIKVAPEAGAAFWDMVMDDTGEVANEWWLERRIRVIDIGSRTVNYCTVNKGGNYLDRDSGTLNYGMLEVYNAAEEPSEEMLRQFTRRVVGDLSKRWLGFRQDRDTVLLTGGGALALEPFFSEFFEKCELATDPVYANASGFFKLGVGTWQDGTGK